MNRLVIQTTENNITQKLYENNGAYTLIKGSIVTEFNSIEYAYNRIMQGVLSLLKETPIFLKAFVEYMARVNPELLAKRFTEQALHMLDIDEQAYIEAVKQAVYYTSLALMKKANITVLSSLKEIDQLVICVENNLISTKEYKILSRLYTEDINIDKSEYADKSLGILINNYSYYREKEISEENILTEIENLFYEKYSVENNKEIAKYFIQIIAETEGIKEENRITLLLTVKEMLEENEEYVKKVLDKNCEREIVKEE